MSSRRSVHRGDLVSMTCDVVDTTYTAAGIEMVGILSFTENPHSGHFIGVLAIV